MNNDLVQRLRDRAYSGLPDPLSEQAADEIERLRDDGEITRQRLAVAYEEIDRLRAATV